MGPSPSPLRSTDAPVPLIAVATPPRSPIAPLPVPLTKLFGREREIDAVASLLLAGDTRLLTLTGPGGVGKTRLAVASAARVAESYDAVWFVPLAAIGDPDLTTTTIARALGVAGAASGSPFARLATMLDRLRGLLVLDNFEQIVAAAPLLTDLLGACPDLRIMVTSRTLLRLSGEQDVPVAPLALPGDGHPTTPGTDDACAAVRLFAARARAVRPDFDLVPHAAAVAEICRRLDGLPLAIELAAARINVLSPRALLAHLEPRLPVLVGGARDQPARLRTMRDAIAWSYDLLAPAQQALFRRLAIFTGGFTLAAAEAVVGESGSREVGKRTPDVLPDFPTPRLPDSVLDAVAALVDQSLVQRVPGDGEDDRYLMLETIRDFGLEQLAACGEHDATATAHLNEALRFAETQRPRIEGAGGRSALLAFEAEHANLRAALAWACQRQDAPAAVRLVAALWKFWWVRGHIAEGRRWLERALALDGEVPPAALGEAVYGAGSFAEAQDDPAAATQWAESLLRISREFGDAKGIAAAMFLLARIAHDRNDLAAAEAGCAAAIPWFRQAGFPHGAAMALSRLGRIHHERGDLDAAEARHREALAIWEQRGDPWGRSNALDGLADVAAARGDRARAMALCRESLAIKGQIGDPLGAACGLAKLASLVGQPRRARAEQAPDPVQAARLFGAAATLFEESGIGDGGLRQEQATIAAIRAELGEAAFAAAWSDGHSRSLEIAVAFAAAPARPSPGKSHPDAATAAGLSPREAEVLRLIAAGHSNREIADLLFVGTRTVTSHATAIYAKLDVTSRTAAVAAARRLGLVE